MVSPSGEVKGGGRRLLPLPGVYTSWEVSTRFESIERKKVDTSKVIT
jgi:hypothetical protein